MPIVALVVMSWTSVGAGADPASRKIDDVVDNALDWLAARQSRIGHWQDSGSRYPTAMTALAGTALLADGSTTTQGKYSKNIRRAVDYLVSRSNPNGLIGDAKTDNRYTYGHGFSMLFLSQVLGEEEDRQRREELIDVLTRAVKFTGEAQTPAGGWGYVSAKDGNNFDEGSTTITQVQGLRGCRNAGIAVPKEVIDKAIAYIQRCTTDEGGVQYNSRGGQGRPAITAAAIACLFNAGEYDNDYVPRMLEYSKKHLGNINNQSFGHWHYAHYYYGQVMYRQGDDDWDDYYEAVVNKLYTEVSNDGKEAFWSQGSYGPVYTTALNLVILQLDKAALPIYQR
ncbi:MAG: prenyltransferase/squalene oxidase repeat-containing protein [Pirellulales bacterium]